MSWLKIINPGLASSIQDLGRSGYLRFGVPSCGALDRESFVLANALVGNEQNVAALEIRYLGPVFEVMAERVRAAIVGARVTVQIERLGEIIPVSDCRSFVLVEGDVVTIGSLRDSSTAYLAVERGFAVAPVLGSCSTDIKAGIGGIKGSLISAGDKLPLSAETVGDRPDKSLPQPIEYLSDEPVRTVIGPQDDYFTDPSIEQFLSTEWLVSQSSDRMGMRLDGPTLVHSRGYNIPSDGIAYGAIQVPGNGQPILLLADRQTTGGYPKIATVISSDLPRCGRLVPGAKIRFQAVDPGKSIAIARNAKLQQMDLIASIAPYHPPGKISIPELYAGNLISPPIGVE